MKRLLVLALLTIPFLKANDRAQGWCEAGNQTISVMGYQSSTTTPVQRSYPGPAAQVYVYLTGTGSPGTLATIYQDNLGTALANPFSASNLGYWFFYAANGRYDVSCVGAGIPSGRITYGDNVLFDQSDSPLLRAAGSLSLRSPALPRSRTPACCHSTRSPARFLSQERRTR